MNNTKNTANIILPIFAVFILFNLIMFPKEMMNASTEGLLLWFNVVLPSIFPFLVTVSLLSATTAPDWLGTILSPLMKPLFKVSGSSAFPFILGMLSGYPMGAKIVSDMEKSKKITPIEAQRLMSFVNNPSPLFVIGTVAAGMMNNSFLGYVILLSTFLGSVVTGIIFGFYHNAVGPSLESKRASNSVPPIGALLNSSVQSSITTITSIGGFIIFFSVIVSALKLSGVLDALSAALCTFSLNALPHEYFSSMLTGFLEMTCGLKSLCAVNLPVSIILPSAALLLSFGGFSILAQTISVISGSSVKISVYITSKIMNSIFSFIICRVILAFITPDNMETSAVFNQINFSFKIFFQYYILLSLAFILLLLICRLCNACISKH